MYLIAVGAALPGEPIDNETLAQYVPVNSEWIELFIGTRTRHLVTDLATGEVRATLTDLCTHAAQQAMNEAGLQPGDIDFLVLGTATPDQLMPATVNLVAERLGVNMVPTYQVQSGCAGAIQALDIGRLLLAGGLGTGLVMGGDVCRKHLVLGHEARTLSSRELVNYVLFGDGAGAAVVSAAPTTGATEVTALVNQLTGLGRPPGQVVDWFGRAEDPTSRPAFSEDYKAIEQHVPVMAVEIVGQLLDEAGWTADDISFILPPQLSGRMTAVIVDRLGLPAAKDVSCVGVTGNTGNALPFLQLRELLELLQPGDRALAVAVESSKWIKAGLALEGR